MHPPNAGVPVGHPSDSAGPWVALTASARGASHAAAGLPNQDAVGTAAADGAAMVSAVADGHGHRRHLRSARGSRIAIAVGIEIGRELASHVLAEPGLLAPPANATAACDRLGRLLPEFVAPDIVRRWRTAVLEDLATEPFSAAEQEQRVQTDDPVIAYGSTLLLAVTIGRWLLLAQIGDGDVGAPRYGRSKAPKDPGEPFPGGEIYLRMPGLGDRLAARVAGEIGEAVHAASRKRGRPPATAA